MQRSTSNETEKPPRPAWRRWLPAILVAGATAAIFLSGAHRHLSLESLVAHRKVLTGFIAERFFLALACFMALYVAVVVLSLPGGALLTITGGFLFGWSIGACAALVAATCGAVLLFLIARSAFGEGLSARAGPMLARFAAGFRRDAASYMLFLRLVPIFPFWLVNLAPALLGVPLATFAWTTLFGIVPATFAFAFAGAGLDSLIAAQSAAFDRCLASGVTNCQLTVSLEDLVTRELLIAFAALGFVALLPIVLRALGWPRESKGSP